jgi:DNA invertase Pin-like site-specific DNA recombinase
MTEKIGYVRTSTDTQFPENQIQSLIRSGIEEKYIFIDKSKSGYDFIQS